MSDRLNWYKSIDDVETHPIKFWRYVSSLRNNSCSWSVCKTLPVGV